jgi:carboxypeptidase PM20D1
VKRRALGLVGWIALGLVVVVVARAGRFSSRQVSPPPAELLPIDSSGAIERLARAIRVPTLSTGDSLSGDSLSGDSLSGDSPSLVALHDLLRVAYPRVHRVLAREAVNGSLLYIWRGTDAARPAVLLAGHLDVVPADSARWSHPPFSGAVADGYIWGRGALDDKVGVLGILEAVEALLGRDFQPARTIYLAFGADEEVGGRRGAAAMAARLREKGVRLEAVIDEGGAILEGIVPGVSAPVATVGVAEKGSVSLALVAEATGGHSSMPPSATAIGLLSRAITRLEADQFPASLRASRGLFEAVGPEMAWPYRVLFANLWLFEPLLVRKLIAVPSTAAAVRTTIAPTIIQGGSKDNVLPGTARAVVNLRILPGETVRSTIDRVRRAVDDPRVTVSVIGEGDDPSPVSRADTAPFLALAAAIRQIHPDVVVAPYLVLGATDARHYAPLTANVYRFLPVHLSSGDLKRVHGVDERIALGDYVNAVRVYAQVIRGLAH